MTDYTPEVGDRVRRANTVGAKIMKVTAVGEAVFLARVEGGDRRETCWNLNVEGEPWEKLPNPAREIWCLVDPSGTPTAINYSNVHDAEVERRWALKEYRVVRYRPVEES